MNFRKNLMTSNVKGKDIVLDMKTFSSICCDIPIIGDITGFGLVCEWDDYDRKKFYLSICRISKEEIERRKQQSLGETVKNRDILSAGYLTLEDHNNESNVACSRLPKSVALRHLHYQNPRAFRRTSGRSCHCRTYKHRTDRQPAPTDEPKPTAVPNQPESHGQSSSSAAMPTNQMIMDELVSLRGYITIRMDAFDTQSHQIQHLTPNERGSILKSRYIRKYAALKEIQKNTLSKRYWFVIIKKGEIVKKISASDLGTVLMKTPTSPKRRKGRLLMKTKKIKASRQ
ncbi:hypothetical protein Lal_00033682 [Lupinus albus]|nr:hypothetical protein Lal_00033673 [Lupinus albus]KAF1894624.1 hypothetical protein Lal_00033682 [Lupinus albus]